ncbi:MAG TPA: phosphopantetheine-binding protein [Methyloceanibacter sp.]|nr:phosphopantetheine-binding protein [Methyloceanibacter sp.]
MSETPPTTLERIKEIMFVHLAVKPDLAISGSVTFDELGLDSLDAVELVMACEEEFGVEVANDADPRTVGDLVALVDRALEARP